MKQLIEEGRAVLGLEFGSTRIKAVLIDEEHHPIAQGEHAWENRLTDGIWTYTMEDIISGLQDCYSDLRRDVREKYDVELTTLRAMGFSGMMHGYLAFNASDELLVPFRTWRNTITGDAAKELSELFQFNIPQRWTISHIRQAMRNQEPHVKEIAFVTTLAGYIHYLMTGRKVVGAGEASGIFPIDSERMDYDEAMVQKFNALISGEGYSFTLREILPSVLPAGTDAGTLTPEGAAILDPSGHLKPGIPAAPPEGDAGTGMAATNSVAKKTGNVSAGTSIFSMIVLEQKMKSYYEEIDMVTTPDGAPVAMVHCNNCTSDLNAWVNLFRENLELMGHSVDMNELYGNLYRNALSGDPDCGGVITYNYFSGEPVTGFTEGRPMVIRTPDATFNLKNFMRANLYSALAALKIGNDILMKEEHVAVDTIYGHGGFFKTKGVGQQILADALNCKVAVMQTAGEGGPWGMALLAAYMVNHDEGETLPMYLGSKVFHGETGESLSPIPENAAGFDAFIEKYRAGIPAEHAAAAVN